MVPILTIWHHWVASNTIGFIAVAPLLIGLAAALRQRPQTNELVEGAYADAPDQFAKRAIDLWPPCPIPRFPPPDGPNSSAMPTKDSFRLHDLDRVKHAWATAELAKP